MSDIKNMTVSELDEFAAENGIDISGAKSKAQKVFVIEKVLAETSMQSLSVMGIEVSISQDMFDDMEVLDCFDQLQSGNVFKLPRLFKQLFREDASRIYDALRNDRGIVTATRASEFFFELMEAANAKN